MPIAVHNPELGIKIELIPSIEEDRKTGLFTAWFEQFPQAIAVAKTSQEAANELLTIFQLMVQEKGEDIAEQAFSQSQYGRHQKIKEVKVYA